MAKFGGGPKSTGRRYGAFGSTPVCPAGQVKIRGGTERDRKTGKNKNWIECGQQPKPAVKATPPPQRTVVTTTVSPTFQQAFNPNINPNINVGDGTIASDTRQGYGGQAAESGGSGSKGITADELATMLAQQNQAAAQRQQELLVEQRGIAQREARLREEREAKRQEERYERERQQNEARRLRELEFSQKEAAERAAAMEKQRAEIEALREAQLAANEQAAAQSKTATVAMPTYMPGAIEPGPAPALAVPPGGSGEKSDGLSPVAIGGGIALILGMAFLATNRKKRR